MARILVADDNSNVQKTVTLALAGLGMDVVSVNNGEAAVRKLADFSPDLVLADIFMPVRNGYEVCDFIKKDSRFSRVPVVLLVGAFDPLDEREAQRVGADGILKKPFVPPDPLITMVKTLLERTMGDHPVAISDSKPAVTAQARVGGSAAVEVKAPARETPEEPSGQEPPSPVERVSFGEGVHPVAFGTLLETSPQEASAPSVAAIEPVDDEQILTSARDATLGDPIFWRNESEEPESEPEAEHPEEGPSGNEMPAWKRDVDSLPRLDDANSLQPVEPLELVHDEQEHPSATIVASEPVLLDQAAQAPLTVEPDKAPDLAANPIEWMATAPPEHSEEEAEAVPGWDEPIPDAVDAIDRVESTEHALDLAPPVVEVPTPVLIPVLERQETPTAANTPEPPVPEPPAALVPATDVAFSPSAQSTTDTARSIPKIDWADLTASVEARAMEPAVQAVRSAPVLGGTPQLTPAIPAYKEEASTDAALVEEVVQRVLEKMRPQVVDIITKEFLRPIVQALVHREIDKR